MEPLEFIIYRAIFNLPIYESIPDEKGLQAAIDALKIAGIAGEKDLLLTLVSGGASAMMPCPPNGIELKDKQAVTDQFADVL